MKKKKTEHKQSPVAKSKTSPIRVMVFGVFDLLHPGHINFLEQARKLGDTLIVSVARDINVERKKGYSPVFGERERKAALKALRLVDKVILGGLEDPWRHIKRENPDVVALGYDQHAYLTSNEVGRLQQELKKYGVGARVVRLKAFRPKKFKTRKIKYKIVNGEEI